MQPNHASNRPGVESSRRERSAIAFATTTPRPRLPEGEPGCRLVGASAPEVERLLEIAREPHVAHVDLSRAAAGYADGAPRSRADDLSEVARHVVNVALAALALVALAPVMLLVAVAVRLSSPGPVIYVQERVGLDRRRRAGGAAAAAGGTPPARSAPRAAPDAAASGAERRREDVGGRPYRMYKFRSMRADAEADGRPVWATREDPRVTRVGRVLRKSRLDELPQLVNVLRGEMNLVGPRPERPAIAARLRDEIDGYALRYRVRPGITGWAQVNHPYDATIDDVRAKVRYDLEYIDRRGVAEDLRILARTVPVMLGRRHGW